MYKFVGRHWLATVRETNVSDNEYVKTIIRQALEIAGANIVGFSEHVFENGAITFCFLLAESHCTVHTYPEIQSMWIDCFTCGSQFDLGKFDRFVSSSIRAGFIETKIITRR